MLAASKRAKTVVLAAFALLVVSFNILMLGPDGKVVKIIIDDAVIDKADPWVIAEPMWWSVPIYDGPEVYDRDLQKFSMPQRYLLAIMWYDAEVNNGGHHQFYLNSTGIVWRDALEGFRAIGADESAKILQASADIMGGSPSLDRDARIRQLDTLGPDAFAAVDNRYYHQNYGEELEKYIKTHRSAFYFTGAIRK
jgi:hypothetical protein